MKYTDLLTVEILHDYYADARARNLRIVPTAECAPLLEGSGIIPKMHRNRFLLVARSDDTDRPYLPVPVETPLTFRLEIDAPEVFALSNLPLDSTSPRRCLFSNRGGAVIDGVRYLHPSPPLFDASKAWAAGSFARDGADVCHESLADHAPGASAIADPAQWRPVGEVGYAAAEHLIAMTGPQATLPVTPPAAEVTVGVFAFNPVSGLHDISTAVQTFTHDAAVQSQPFSFAQLPGGVYRVNVNGADTMYFHRSRQDWYDAAGFVQLVHGDSVAPSHRLLNNDGTFAHPVFAIRIAPRSVLWQYQARSTRVKSVLDGSGTRIFSPAGPNLFRSTLPHRLQETAADGMTIEFNDTEPVDPSKTIVIENIEVPGFRYLGSAVQNGTSYITSQVFLNY
jgi:hypothetical protein